MSSRPRLIMSLFARLTSCPKHLSRALPSTADQALRQQRFISHDLGHRHLFSYSSRIQNYYNTSRRKFSVYNDGAAGASLPSRPPSPSPLNWILGIFLSVVFPFFGNKWAPFLQFKQEVDTVVDTIEEIVDIVEKVAEVVDKVAEGISEDLPEGGKLKKVVDAVENVAEKTAKDVHAVGDVIDKFQEVEDKVESIVGDLSDNQGNENQNSNKEKDET